MSSENLWRVARGITDTARCEVTIAAISAIEVRVTATYHARDLDDDDAIVVWEGPMATWAAAAAEALSREPFAGTIPGWQPGPFEREGTPWMNWA